MTKDVAGRYRSVTDVLGDLHRLGSRPQAPASDAAGPEVPSIAVLPFANMSADPEQEYFCDGLAEEPIDALARLEGLAEHDAASRSGAL